MKRKLGPRALMYPLPIVLVGTSVDGLPNYTLVGDCALMGIRVPIVCISLAEGHHSTKGVLQTGRFSINIPSTELLEKVDYCGLVSGARADKASIFDTFYGELGDVPLIGECRVNMECQVVHQHQIKNRHIFIGEVIQTHVDDRYVEDNEGRVQIADLVRLDPIIYGLDNHYYQIGPVRGEGYKEGQPLLTPNRFRRE